MTRRMGSSAIQLTLARDSINVSTEKSGFSMVSSSSWSAALQGRGLLTAAFYGTDASAPERLQTVNLI